ncbi:hypothetical protein [Thermostilla marina]
MRTLSVSNWKKQRTLQTFRQTCAVRKNCRRLLPPDKRFLARRPTRSTV